MPSTTNPEPADAPIPQRDIGGVIEHGFSILRHCGVRLVVLSATLGFVFSAISYAIERATLAEGSTVRDGLIEAPDGAGFWATYGGQGAAVIVFALGYQIIMAGLLTAAIPASAGYTVTRIPWRSVRAIAPPALLLSILVALGIVAGIVLLIVPGVWFAVASSMATSVLVAEALRGPDAIRRSVELVRGRWWPTFGTLLVVGIITGVLAQLAVAIVSRGVDDAANLLLADAAATFVASVLTMPISASVSATLYLDLRTRKEPLTRSSLADLVDSGPAEPAAAHASS